MSMESPGVEHHLVLQLCRPTVDVLPVWLCQRLGVGLTFAPELPSLSEGVGHALLCLGLQIRHVGLLVGIVAGVLLGSKLHHALDIVLGEGVEVGEGTLREYQGSLAAACAAYQLLPLLFAHAQINAALRVEEIELCHRGHIGRALQSAADGLAYLVVDVAEYGIRAVDGVGHGILRRLGCGIY